MSSPSPKILQFGLVLASTAMIGCAALIWSGKVHQSSDSAASPVAFSSSPQAMALLAKSFHADNEVSYSALSTTTAFVGGKCLDSQAQITSAPRHLSIKFLTGPLKGTQSGYSERWFWRQDAAGAMRPYAEVAHDANQVSARRFALLSQNYEAQIVGSDVRTGRPVSVVELRPLHPVDGAKGPARRLYIDDQTGLTLGIESFNAELKPVMRSALSNLEIAPRITQVTFEPPTAIMASLKGHDWQGEELGDDQKKAAQKTGFEPPQASYVPPGFQLDGYGVHRCRCTGTLQPSALTRYCDGLNSLTIYAFKPSAPVVEKTMRGKCDFGPGTMSSREDNGGRLVAVGDLPPQTLQRVLASAHFEMAR